MADRASLIKAFLAESGWDMAPRARLAGDASARRYERLTLTGRGIAVLMDAPPESGQDTGAFVRIADWLRSQGLSAPKILAADTANGLLLLEDFGDAVFGRLAAGSPEVELGLYRAAGEMLITLQGCAVPDWVPHPTPADLSSLIGPVFTGTPPRLASRSNNGGNPKFWPS